MLEIYLTRHGETEWNQVRRMQGQGNSPLTELGKKQASWLAQRLEGKTFEAIYTSPLGRARETAELINETLKTKVIADDRLKEIYLGEWQGMLIEDIEKDHSKENNDFWHNPLDFNMANKEDFKDVRERGGAFFEELIEHHGSGKILVVAHAIILKGMLNYIMGSTLKEFWDGKHILPTSLTKITVVDNRYSFVYMGDTSHHKEAMEKGWFIEE